MASQLSPSKYVECYVFVDHSNLWIEGQKAQEVKDVDHDPRYRVDLGKFLTIITKNRQLSKAFLYGSVPPPNDSVWKAAKEKNFEVKVFQRSINGKEKDLDVAMAHDITKTLYEHIYINGSGNVTFITVTGDRDLKPPIEDLLEKGIPVELWSWEKAMAREYKQLANSHHLFQAKLLNTIKKDFSYTAFMSTRRDKLVNPAFAIVFREVPRGKRFLYNFANTIARLMRLFYITRVLCEEEGKCCDLIVEFPKTKPDIVLRMLKKLKLSYEPCSYPEYTNGTEELLHPLQTTNRFQAIGDLDDDSWLDAVESSIGTETAEEYSSMSSLENTESIPKKADSDTDTDTEKDGDADGDDWITVAHRKVGRMARLKKLHETPCQWKEHCGKAEKCPYLHTDHEKKLFRLFPKYSFRYWKTQSCEKKHGPNDDTKYCKLAHEPKDSWCLNCTVYGHLTWDCQVETTTPYLFPNVH